MSGFEKTYKNLVLSIEDTIARIQFNSPPVNAITVSFMDDLEAAVCELEKLEEIRAVVITSALEKVFIAGADIKAFQHMDGEGTMEVSRRGNPVFNKIEQFPAPVICAVNGVAFGGGLELALSCDLRVFDEKAKVGFPETSLGIIPGYGGTWRLPRIIGEAEAKKMLFTAAPIRADEAYRIGLAQKVVPEGQSGNEAIKLARAIAQNAPLAVMAAKRCVQASRELNGQACAAYETSQGGLLFQTQDKLEGITAFLEKRPPEFRKC